jgi:hypothetical protein
VNGPGSVLSLGGGIQLGQIYLVWQSAYTSVSDDQGNGGTSGDQGSWQEVLGPDSIVPDMGPGDSSAGGAAAATYKGVWYRGTLPGTNWCGPGGHGDALTRIDAACQQHDACYAAAGASFFNYVTGLGGADMQATIANCNRKLCQILRTLFDTSEESGQATIVGIPFGCSP